MQIGALIEVVEQIRESISRPMRLEPRRRPTITSPHGAHSAIEFAITCSVGVTRWHAKGRVHTPSSDADVWDLLRANDDAMYKSKKAGKNKVHVLQSESPVHMRAALVQ